MLNLALLFLLIVALGAIIYLLIERYILRNVTMRRRVLDRTVALERQAAMLSTIYKSIPDLVLTKDREGKYTTCNPSFEAFAGRPEAEIIGKADVELFQIDPEMARLFVEADQRVLRDKRTETIEEVLTYPDGSHRTVETLKTPLYQDGMVIGMTRICQDSVHDPEKAAASLKQIEASSQHLLGILNDVLDMSKIESGKMELAQEPFHVRGAFDEVQAIIQQRCHDKGIAFLAGLEDDGERMLRGDKMRLNQVLINLLGNAVKFTPEGGSVSLSIRPETETDATIAYHFVVSDTGIGMSAAQQSRLFQAFEQTEATIARRFGGTGLGLAISQNIVRLMGGLIEVESAEGKGSTFSFSLTFDKAAPVAEQAQAVTEIPDLAGHRILLVEDIEINREIILHLLMETGVAIDQACDGQQALDMMAAAPPGAYDLVYMDIQMPRMDGYEATRRIRALDAAWCHTVPIIAMTANAYQEDVQAALDAGMNGHLAKPIDFGKLLASLQTIQKGVHT